MGTICTRIFNSEFFTNAEAMNDYKNKLRYIIARYSYSTAVFGWEFFNEVSLFLHDRGIHHNFVCVLCVFFWSVSHVCLFCGCVCTLTQVDLTDNYETAVQANWISGTIFHY